MPSFRPHSIAPKLPLARGLFRHALLAGVALGLSGCLSGQDAYYGNGSEAADVAAVKRMMAGVGLTDPETKPIDYKPRARLAVPPTAGELPDPEASVTETANLPANWPRDKNAELLALQKSRDLTGTEALRENDRFDRRSTPDEIQAGTRNGAGAGPTAEELQARRKNEMMKDNVNTRLTPTQLRTQKLNKAEPTAMLDENGLPERRYLIEPPVEYSKPAKGAELVVPEVKDDTSKEWLEEMRRR